MIVLATNTSSLTASQTALDQAGLDPEEFPLGPIVPITYKSPSFDEEISPKYIDSCNKVELSLLGALSCIPPPIESSNSQSSTIYNGPPPCTSYYGGIQFLDFDFQYSSRHRKRFPTCTSKHAYCLVSGAQIIFARKSWNFPGRIYVAERCLKVRDGLAHVEVVTYRLDGDSVRDPDAPPYIALFPEECVHMPNIDALDQEDPHHTTLAARSYRFIMFLPTSLLTLLRHYIPTC